MDNDLDNQSPKESDQNMEAAIGVSIAAHVGIVPWIYAIVGHFFGEQWWIAPAYFTITALTLFGVVWLAVKIQSWWNQ